MPEIGPRPRMRAALVALAVAAAVLVADQPAVAETPTKPTAAAAAAVTTPRTIAVDVSAQTGKSITGPITALRTGIGSGLVEYVAGTTTAGALVVFRRPHNGAWQVTDASAEAGRAVRSHSPLTSWNGRDGDVTVQHVAAVGAGGELLVFWWSPRTGRWQYADATAESGQRVAHGLTSWQTTDGSATVDHIAGVTSDGRLLVFWWAPGGGGWHAVNASGEAGRASLSSHTLTAWRTQDGSFTVEHVAAVGSGGELLTFWWSPRTSRWQVTDATAQAGQRAGGGLTSWTSTDNGTTVEHIGAVSNARQLVFWRTAGGGAWHAVDATQIARGPAVTGGSAKLPPPLLRATPEMVVSRSSGSRLLLHWWAPTLDWQVADLYEATGLFVYGDPVAWRTTTGTRTERIAVLGGSGHLLVFESAGQERHLVEALRTPVPANNLQHKRNLRRKVLTILWDPHKPNMPRPTKAVAEASVLGATQSVRDFYLQNSGGQFTIESAGVLGWYDSDYAPSEYWPGGDVPGRDSGAEAIRKAAAEFDFAQYDTNNDGDVHQDELAILFVLPGDGDGDGLIRTVGEDYSGREGARGITVDGKRIRSIAEVSLGAPPGPGITAHELSHLILGLGDMYFDDYFNPYASNAYSLMDQDGQAPHIDAPNKLKLGWLHPRPILSSGRHSLRDVARNNEAWALYHPARPNEYFIIENRWGGTSYDTVLPDKGLAIWHVVDDEPTWRIAPPGVPQSNWDKSGGWARLGIRLIRPSIAEPIDDTKSLWSSGDPEAAQDLALKWADGTPSGFVLRGISAAGATMSAQIQVPAL
jgi:M6 family metalloprotease-like protein